jgi:hypothetical protein
MYVVVTNNMEFDSLNASFVSSSAHDLQHYRLQTQCTEARM